MRFKVGILDHGRNINGEDRRNFLQETIRQAQLAEALGFSRYWLSEHPVDANSMWSSSALMVGQIAGATEKIRVGSGGVLLSETSPIRVVDDFKLLSNLFPERIDLGLARALARTKPEISPFESHLCELRSYLNDGEASDKVLKSYPHPSNQPKIFLLGSGTESQRLAEKYNLDYCHACYDDLKTEPNLKKTPQLKMVTVAGVCVESKNQSEPMKRWVTGSKDIKTQKIFGTPDDFHKIFSFYEKNFSVTDFLFIDVSFDWKIRKKSMQLISQAFLS